MHPIGGLAFLHSGLPVPVQLPDAGSEERIDLSVLQSAPGVSSALFAALSK